MTYLILVAVVTGTLYVGWKLTSRNAYESAEYTLLERDDNLELREYPDLMMASTRMSSVEGGDDSFGRLFRYISGGNKKQKKVAMTTPVFMEPKTGQAAGQMGFVIPKKVAESHVPEPASDQVELIERAGGKFAVMRFSGRLRADSLSENLSELEGWIERCGFEVAGEPEFASYDPPWTPDPLRRNAILLRIK